MLTDENELSKIIKDIIEIIDGRLSYYPIDIFPHPVKGCCVDRYAAAGCRMMGRFIKEEVLKYYAEYGNDD